MRLGTREGLRPVVPLGFSDGLELGLRLGTREGLRPGMPFGFSDGFKLGLRLGTREGLRPGLPFGFSDGLKLLRLNTKEGLRLGVPFGFSDRLKLGLRVCPGPQLCADTCRDVVKCQKYAALDVNMHLKRHLLFSVPIQSCSIVVPRAENADDLSGLLLIKMIKRPTDR